MKWFWITSCFLILCLGCGEGKFPTPQAACHLSIAGEEKITSLLADAASLAKQRQFAISDSIARLALTVLDTCNERIWLYRCHYRLSMNAWNDNRKDEATYQCAKWAAEAVPVQDSVSGYYHSLLGWLYFVQENFEAARPCLEKAAGLLEMAGRTEKLSGVYNNLGPCLIRLGDYESAEHYLRAAIRLNAAARDTHRLAINYHNLGRNYNAYGQSQKALECFQRSADLAGEKDGSFYIGVTKAYFNLQDLPRAKASAIQGLAASVAEGADPSAMAGALQWLGQVAAGMNQPEKAITYYTDALAKWSLIGDTAQYDFGKTNIFLGDTYCALHKPYKALVAYQSALCVFMPRLDQNDLHSNPTIEQLPNEIWIMEALRGKAQAWEQCFDKTEPKDPRLLKNALESAEIAAMAMLHMKGLYQEDLSKLNLDTYGSLRFFEKAVQLACRVATETKDSTYLQRAFCLSQRSKADILRNALMERHALLSANLPVDSIHKLDRLQMAIALTDKLLDAVQEIDILDSLENKRFHLKRDWLKMQNWANGLLPKTASPTDIGIPDLQQRLSSDALLVEYFVGAHTLYTFAVSASGFTVFETAMPRDFGTTCALFQRSISDIAWVRDSAASAEKTYLSTADALYKLLLSKILSHFPNSKRLVVVPDGELGRIPFAALLSHPYNGSWRDTDLPILLRRCTVGYLYSSALLQNSQAAKPIKNGFGGFGTDYRDLWTLAALNTTATTENPGGLLADVDRSGLGILDNADDEVDSIAQLTGGDKWLNKKATKARFLQKGGDYGILHFALHTVPASPKDLSGFYLVFSKTDAKEDNFLSANELASLDLKAELAVLSACYSGLGNFQQGEGTMSLGRAFALAGCPATLVNLWAANDEVSKQIMIRFYKNLQAGKPKDVALQEAQLDYLQQTTSTAAIPFYWANVVAMGDMSPIEVRAKHGWWD